MAEPFRRIVVTDDDPLSCMFVGAGFAASDDNEIVLRSGRFRVDAVELLGFGGEVDRDVDYARDLGIAAWRTGPCDNGGDRGFQIAYEHDTCEITVTVRVRLKPVELDPDATPVERMRLRRVEETWLVTPALSRCLVTVGDAPS
jgi:hypothetical protein